MLFPKKYSLLLPALVMTLSGCEQPPAAVAPAPPKVNVAHPVQRDIVQADVYNGQIQATDTVDVRARVRGHIQKVDFTDGQIVQKDQPLFELDPRPFEADVARAEDQLKVIQAQLVAAQKEEARLKDLLTKGGSSQSQVDKAEADALSFAAQVGAAEQEIQSQKLNLEYSKVTAAITGRIGRAMLTVGNMVNAGGTDPVLATIVSVDPVYVYFDVDERTMQGYMNMRKENATATRSGALKASQLPFQFGLESEKGYPHEGVLDFVDNQVDTQTGTVQVRGTVPNPQGMFVAGSRANVRVPIGDAKSTVLVPDTAILADQDRRYVLVIDDKNVVQRRDISPGRLQDDGMRIVLAGDKGPAVTPHDWIIVQGMQFARINYPVEPIKPVESQPAGAAAAIP